jgi:exodeoxyribonuclease III
MPIRVMTWNINSIRLRIETVARVSQRMNPDVLCFQEIKCREAEFPFSALKEMGYDYFAVNAQKGYHGVAIASRIPIKQTSTHDFCKSGEARHVAATLELPGETAEDIEIHNFYVPAGGDIPDPQENPKYKHKLEFLDEMRFFFDSMNGRDEKQLMLVGDLNVAPLEFDVWSHKALLSVVSHTPEEVERLNLIFQAGDWKDPIRQVFPEPERVFTWWSYRSPNWALANKGRRLDHMWINPKLAARATRVEILKEVRGWERPSDHVPVVLELF